MDSPAGPRLSGRGFWAAVLGILALALGLRLALVGWGLAPIDADSATTGLMARKILHGENFLFFTGQRYLGSIEQYATAAAVALLGENRWSRTIVGILLGTLACGQVMMLTHRWAPARTARAAALAAGLAAALGPIASVLWSIWPRGAHMAAVVTTLAVLDLATRARILVPAAAVQGFLTTFGVWLSLATVLISGPALWWMLGRLRCDNVDARPAPGHQGPPPRAQVGAAGARMLAFLAGAGFGLAPVAWAYLGTGRGVDWFVGAQDPTIPYLNRLLAVMTHSLPQAMGTESLAVLSWYTPKWTPLIPGIPGWAGALLGYGAVVVVSARRWRSLRDALLLRRGTRSPIDLLLAILLAAPWLEAASRLAWMVNEPRYLVNYFPLIVITAVLAAAHVRRRRLALAALALVVAASAASTLRFTAQEVAVRSAPAHPSGEAVWQTIADAAANAGVKHIGGNYWTTQPVDWYGHGRFDVLERTTAQFRPDRPSPRAPGPWAIIDEERHDTQWHRWFAARGLTYRVVHAGGISLFLDFSPRLTSQQILSAVPTHGWPFPT